MSCPELLVTVAQPPAMAVTVAPAPAVAVTLAAGQGPAGTGNGGVGGAPVAVNSSRALTADDAGRVLQCAHGVTLTVPEGLAASFGCQLLMNAPQVWAGGQLTLATAGAVTVNGAGSDWTVERTVGSSAPWLAWLQRETGADAYALVAIGAQVAPVVTSGAGAVLLESGDRLLLENGDALLLEA